jgi:hypothetical protein
VITVTPSSVGFHSEHAHGHAVVHAQAERRRVNDLQAALEGILVGDAVDLVCVGVGARVVGVDPVDTVLGHQDDRRADLERALGGHGVGGEVRQAGAGAEDDDAALLEVPFGTTGDVRLGDLGHGDGGLHARLGTGLLEEVLQGEGVHDGAEHAHVVGAAAVHAALGEFRAAEEVAAADDDGDLDGLGRFGDLPREAADDVGVDAEASGPECFAGQFEEDPALGTSF